MSIHELQQHRINSTKIQQTEQMLKPGQIVNGKITKLFPGNKAEIQIGSRKLVAQLKASLTVGERYHFQVEMEDDTTYLRVLGNKLLNQSDAQNTSQLLKQLNMRANKQQLDLVQSLIKENIPFDRTQLKQAFKLLEINKDMDSAKLLIKAMISAKAPLTPAVFDTLNMNEKNMFSTNLNRLLHTLNAKAALTETERNVVQIIKQITDKPLPLDKQFLKEINTDLETNKQSMFQAIKMTGFIEENASYEDWKKFWGKETTFEEKLVSRQSPQTLTNLAKTIKNESENMLNAFEKLSHNKYTIMQHMDHFKTQFLTKINHAITTQSPLSNNDFEELKQFMMEKIIPLVPERQQVQIEKMIINEPASLGKLVNVIHSMQHNDVFEKLNFILKNSVINEELLSQPMSRQFFDQMKNIIELVGLNYEHKLSTNQEQQASQTMKSSILQLLQSTDGATREQPTQLLHVINNLQLQSITETNNTLLAQLQIPGEKFGLNNDIQLKFEGGKKEGKIDSDFCRIVFDLHLGQLKETVIDMNVQKRSVTLTVYNDHDSYMLKQLANPIEGELKNGLESVGYHLSSLNFSMLTEREVKPSVINRYENSALDKGVDYWV